MDSVRSIVEQPTATLISLADAKVFVNETHEVRDNMIADLVAGGIIAAEEHLNRAVRRQRRQWRFFAPPVDQILLEPFFDADDNHNVTVERAESGAWVELSASEYSTSGATGEIFPAFNDYDRRFRFRSIREPKTDYVGAFAYRATVDVGWDEIPEDLKNSVLSYVKDLYDQRGVRDIGRPLTKPWAGVEHYSWRFG